MSLDDYKVADDTYRFPLPSVAVDAGSVVRTVAEKLCGNPEECKFGVFVQGSSVEIQGVCSRCLAGVHAHCTNPKPRAVPKNGDNPIAPEMFFN